jgi:hypothetical protein
MRVSELIEILKDQPPDAEVELAIREDTGPRDETQRFAFVHAGLHGGNEPLSGLEVDADARGEKLRQHCASADHIFQRHRAVGPGEGRLNVGDRLLGDTGRNLIADQNRAR